jgi:hypothetical protein
MSFRIAQKVDGTLHYLSGWSQSRLQPTFSPDTNAGLIWIDRAKFDRWQAKHPSMEWDFITLIEVAMPEPRDRGGERFRRENRRRA